MKSLLISKKNLIASLSIIKTFCDKEIPKADSNHTCLAVISLDSALKKDENYYPHVFLKECKYIEKNVVRPIHYNLNDFSSSFDEKLICFLINT